MVTPRIMHLPRGYRWKLGTASPGSRAGGGVSLDRGGPHRRGVELVAPGGDHH